MTVRLETMYLSSFAPTSLLALCLCLGVEWSSGGVAINRSSGQPCFLETLARFRFLSSWPNQMVCSMLSEI